MPRMRRRPPQRLVERLHKRQAELDRERQITALPPVLKGAALVIPQGLLKTRSQQSTHSNRSRTASREDPVARALVEKARHGRGHGGGTHARQHAEGCVGREEGLDIESRDPRSGHLRFIEVKGRHADGRDVIITKNEILASLNAPDAFILALVRVVQRLRARAGLCAAILQAGTRVCGNSRGVQYRRSAIPRSGPMLRPDSGEISHA